MKTPLWILIAASMLLSACARLDYHGMDPDTYNEVLYPKVNTVKHNSIYHGFYFEEHSPRFDQASIDAMDTFLARSYPDAVTRLELTFGLRDPDRELYLTRLLRARGFKKSNMDYVTDSSMHPDEVIITMDYSYVETPRCPDWRKDPLINYSNRNHSDFGCTTVTNFGRQAANPHDLVQSSTTRIQPDANRNALAIGTYHSGTVATSSESEEGGE